MNGFKFRRQQPIGRYIVDFFCPEQRLVIELDGGHHAHQAEADMRRTEFLNKAGYRILRFWDHEVLANTEAVLHKIANELNAPPHPALSLQGRGSCKDHPSPQPSPARSEGVAKSTPHPNPLPQGARGKKPLTLALSLKGRGDHGGKR